MSGRGKRIFRVIWMVVGMAICSCLWSGPRLAQAEDEGKIDEGRVIAVQVRKFRMNHELTVGGAFLPLDAFYKFFGVSFQYVLHFTDLWAWEAVHFTLCKYLQVSTGLEKELNDNWDASITNVKKVDFMLDSNLMFKPLYGKMVLFDGLTVNLETYFLTGVGMQQWNGDPYPSVNLGVGMRAFFNNRLSVRIETRDYVYMDRRMGFENTLYMSLLFAYNAFSEDRVYRPTPEGKEVKK